MTGDVDNITSIWQVLAIAVIVGTPALFGWLNSKAAKEHAKRGADEIIHQSNPNSGKSLKDSLNRIEGTLIDVQTEQTAQGARLTAVEQIVAPTPNEET